MPRDAEGSYRPAANIKTIEQIVTVILSFYRKAADQRKVVAAATQH